MAAATVYTGCSSAAAYGLAQNGVLGLPNPVKGQAVYVVCNVWLSRADDFRLDRYTETSTTSLQRAASYGGPLFVFGRCDLEVLLTPPRLKAAMPQASEHNVMRFVPELVKAMAHYSISSTLRMAHFLAQVAQESGQLSFTEELASGTAYEDRADLGNVEPGDGIRFKGRGLIQITGRSNYRAYSHACGQELLSGNHPSRLATDPALAADVAGWFWQVHKLNALADSDDLERITRRINGGVNGLPERRAFLALAKAALEHVVEHTTAEAHPSGPAPPTESQAAARPSAAANPMQTTAALTNGTHPLAQPMPQSEAGNIRANETRTATAQGGQFRSAA